MSNLLGSYSDSDSQELLNLPPLKAKKPKILGKRKRSPHSESDCLSYLKWLFCTLTVAGLIALAIVSYNLMYQIDEVRKNQNTKLESQTRPNVDFKPVKRMKKRRELDALVGHGKLRRKCRGSGQELLRPAGEEEDTDSSDTEFTVPAQKAISRKRSRSSVCTTCLTVSGFLVLVACLVACGTLLWMHFALRKNLNYFQKKLERVESQNHCTPEEFQRLHTQIQELNKTLNNFKDGKNGLQTVLTKVSSLSTAVAELKKKTVNLDDRVAMAPLLQTLPKKVETTSKSLATLGSDMNNLKGMVESLQKKHQQATEKYADVTTKLKALEHDTVNSEIDQLNITSIENMSALRKHLGELDNKMENEVLRVNNISAAVIQMSAQVYALNSSKSELQNQIQKLKGNISLSSATKTTATAETTTPSSSSSKSTMAAASSSTPNNSPPSSTSVPARKPSSSLACGCCEIALYNIYSEHLRMGSEPLIIANTFFQCTFTT